MRLIFIISKLDEEALILVLVELNGLYEMT